MKKKITIKSKHEAELALQNFPVVECSCNHCKQMCQNPCIPTPEEAIKLIELGYGPELTTRLFYSEVLCEDIEVVLPIKIHKIYSLNNCIFQDVNGLCELHDLGLKPLEGKLALHGMSFEKSPHSLILLLWHNNEVAKKVIELYNREVG